METVGLETSLRHTAAAGRPDISPCRRRWCRRRRRRERQPTLCHPSSCHAIGLDSTTGDCGSPALPSVDWPENQLALFFPRHPQLKVGSSACNGQTI